MVDKITTLISQELNIPLSQVAGTVGLLRDDNSIPFISRYRKEATGGLDDVAIQSIDARLNYYNDLQKRKSTILKSIEAQDKLTDELSLKISNCWDANTLEDIYLPFKPKRRTRAQVARERGLEPLAKIIMAQHGDNIEARARAYVTDQVPDVEAAVAGAQDIIAEWVSENQAVRNSVRRAFRHEAVLTSHYVKGKEIEGRNYENYYDYSQPLRRVSSHQLLAMRRGEKEGFLKVTININDDRAIDNVCRIVVRGHGQAASLVEEAATDSYKRLIKPSIETEFAAQSKAVADDEAIEMFARNARELLFAPPLGHKRVLAVDPGFRTGCKVVCLDQNGNLKHHTVIYPTAPHYDIDGARATMQELVKKYDIDAIALGNGTASRETERFLKRIDYGREVNVYVVSENGASIYSASPIARQEFPHEDVTVRGAVSIGRRLLDPLAELVKIDPKSIGVGQYQHDVDQNKLKEALHFTCRELCQQRGREHQHCQQGAAHLCRRSGAGIGPEHCRLPQGKRRLPLTPRPHEGAQDGRENFHAGRRLPARAREQQPARQLGSAPRTLQAGRAHGRRLWLHRGCTHRRRGAAQEGRHQALLEPRGGHAHPGRHRQGAGKARPRPALDGADGGI
jgi:uncharacterized protein